MSNHDSLLKNIFLLCYVQYWNQIKCSVYKCSSTCQFISRIYIVVTLNVVIIPSYNVSSLVIYPYTARLAWKATSSSIVMIELGKIWEKLKC